MKNKIISILCIFILISFLFINVVFASTTYDLTQISYIKNGLNWFIFNNSAGNYLICCTQSSRNVLYYLSSSGHIMSRNSTNTALGVCNIYKMEEDGTLKYICSMSSQAEYESTYSLGDILYSSCDIVVDAGTTVFFKANATDEYFITLGEPDIIYPGISNTAEDLATGTFDYILVAPGTFSNTENIGLNIYNITNLEDGEDIYSRKPIFSTTLNSSSSFYNSIVVEDQTEFWYEIPRANLNIDFKNGNTYFYSLLLDGSPIQEVQATIGGLTEEDILNNNFDNLQTSINESNKELQETIIESNKEVQESIDKQTEAIEENNKTNKNIFEKIGEILSYLNPFSENFFAYKLVELIVDGLKSLFIPADDFFSLYFDELNNWFSDRLGFLYYPLELLFDLLDRFLNINFAEPIINIPNIKEPFTNVTLIKSVSFNFNDLLENETLKNVHDIYFIIVDAVIYIGLVGLLYRKYEEVMTK